MLRLSLVALLCLTGLTACDDDESGDGNGGDVAADSGAGDTNGTSDSDAAADVIDETSDDDAGVGDAGVGDAAADAGDDSDGTGEDASPDVPIEDAVEEVADVAEEPDIPPSPYEFCPYESPAAAVDCNDVCTAVTACGGDGPDCLQNCEAVQPVISADAAADLESCIENTTCEEVPEGQDMGRFCFDAVVGAAEPTSEVADLCEDLDAAADTCEGEDSGFEPVCLFVAPIVRAEALTQIEECLDAECVYFFDCIEAAFCDLI